MSAKATVDGKLDGDDDEADDVASLLSLVLSLGLACIADDIDGGGEERGGVDAGAGASGVRDGRRSGDTARLSDDEV
jgi:hypothetical protein